MKKSTPRGRKCFTNAHVYAMVELRKGAIYMKLTEKLTLLMEKQGLTRGGLARATGIPYSTIVCCNC